jgi:hypothetical protein
MKKVILVLVSFFLIQFSQAQDKLKGNKNVTTQHREIDNFNAILIKDNLHVSISESPNSKVSVETDENLQIAVETRVTNGVLEVYLSQPIARKKKLNVVIGVTDSIQKIEVRDNASLIGENEIHCTNMNIVAQDNASLKLKFRLNNLTATIDDRSDATIEASTKDDVIIALDHNADLKLKTTCDKLSVNVSESSLLKASGNCKDLEIISNDNGSFKGKELLTDNATVQATDRSDVYINASKKLVVNIENNAELYIYDNPELIIEKFSDKATLFKK